MSEEHLEDGFSPRTPDGDNLACDLTRLEIRAWQAFGRAGHARVEHDRELGISMVDTGCPSAFGNPAHLERRVSDPGALAARLRDFYGAGNGAGAVLFSAMPTPDLTPFGLLPVGHPPLMVRAADASLPPAPDGLRVEAVATADALFDFERTFVDAYPVPQCAPARPGVMIPPALVSHDRWRLFVGYADDEPVATAAAFVGDALVDVVLVATRDEARGRGYGAAVTGAATLADPAKPAALIASDLGRSVYERMGYRSLFRFTLWVCPNG